MEYALTWTSLPVVSLVTKVQLGRSVQRYTLSNPTLSGPKFLRYKPKFCFFRSSRTLVGTTVYLGGGSEAR